MKQPHSPLPSARILAGIPVVLALVVPALLLWRPGDITASAAQPPGGACTVAAAGAVDYNVIQDAIDDLSCRTIFVAAGTYSEGLLIQRDLTIYGAASSGPNATIIARPPGLSSSVVTVNSGASVTMADLSVRDGFAAVSGGGIRNFNADLHLNNVMVLDNFSAQSGGGIYSTGGTLTMEDSTVARNQAGENGGGAWIGNVAAIENTTVVSNTAGTSALITQTLGAGIFIYDTGFLALRDSLVTGNTLTPGTGVDAYGGGIYVADSTVSPYIGRLLMDHTTVSGNQPEGISAGLASVEDYAQPVIDILDSAISDNTGAGIATVGWRLNITDTVITRNAGDGIFWMHESSRELKLRRVEISENGSMGINGGFLLPFVGWGELRIYDSTIRDNGSNGVTAYRIRIYDSTIRGNQGTGVYGLEQVVIQNSTISGNSAAWDGGGVFIGGSGELYMTNSTVSGNSAANFGGGIFLENGAGGELNASTVAFNTGDSDGNQLGDVGGIMSSVGSPILMTVRNSIIAGNATLNPTSQSPDCFGDFDDDGYNLVGVVDGCEDVFIFTAIDILGTFASPVDPLLDVLADNGGPTLTHALLPGSPARNWIFSNCYTLDQRGAPRAVYPFNCEIGAYEVAACPAAVVPTGFAIGRSGRDALLSWSGDPADREYVLSRGLDPYDLGSAVEIASLPNGVNADLDFGVLEDVQSNYFYAVQGENACGARSAPTPVLGEYSFALKATNIVGPKFQLVTIPLTGGGLPATADQAAAYIDPGGSVKRVAVWNPATGSFIVRVVGCAVCGSNFVVGPGDSMAVVYNRAAPPAFAWVGAPPPAGSFSNPLQPNSVIQIQVPLDMAGQFPPNAAGLLASIGGVSYAARWDNAAQSWQIYTAGGGGTNFSVVPGGTYVILTGPGSPPNWP